MVLFAYGGVLPRTHQAILDEIQYAGQNRINLVYKSICNTALICKSRSDAMSEFWQAGTEELIFMVDHDMQWKKGDICAMAEAAYCVDTVVGALYSKRKMGKGFCACDGEVKRRYDLKPGQHTLERCERVATGMIAIPKSVPARVFSTLDIRGEPFQKRMRRAMWDGAMDRVLELGQYSLAETVEPTGPKRTVDFFRTMRVLNSKRKYNLIGEDFSFSLRCQYAGIIPRLDMGVIPIHWGEHGFTIHDGEKHGGEE